MTGGGGRERGAGGRGGKANPACFFGAEPPLSRLPKKIFFPPTTPKPSLPSPFLSPFFLTAWKKAGRPLLAGSLVIAFLGFPQVQCLFLFSPFLFCIFQWSFHSNVQDDEKFRKARCLHEAGSEKGGRARRGSKEKPAPIVCSVQAAAIMASKPIYCLTTCQIPSLPSPVMSPFFLSAA